MADKKYAISFTAVKLDGKGNIGTVNGVNVIEAPDSGTANRAAMQFALEKSKPSDGFIGHLASAMEVPVGEVKQTKWFMP